MDLFWSDRQREGVPKLCEQGKSICKLCLRRVPAKREMTMNLFAYLEKHHPDAFTEIVPPISCSISHKRKQPALAEAERTTRSLKVTEGAATDSSRSMVTTFPRIYNRLIS